MSSCQDLLSLSLWGMLTVAWGFQGNYFDCSFMIQTQGMFTALPNRCILCTGIKSPYRISKVQDFLLISFHFPRPLAYQRLRSSFSCCLPPSWVMLWKKLQLHFGLFFEFGKKSTYEGLPGVCVALFLCFVNSVSVNDLFLGVCVSSSLPVLLSHSLSRELCLCNI